MLLWTFLYKFLCGHMTSFHLGVALLGHIVTLLNILRNSQTFSKVVAPFYNPTNNVWGFQFFHMLDYTCYLSFIVVDGCEVISHCSFGLQITWFCKFFFFLICIWILFFFFEIQFIHLSSVIQIFCVFSCTSNEMRTIEVFAQCLWVSVSFLLNYSWFTILC